MSVEELKQSLRKLAAGELANDEDKTTVGVLNVHENPTDRESGTIDAHWGSPGNPDPSHNGQGVYDEWKKDHEQLLGRVFDGMENASKADKVFISANFKTRDYSSHSALLNHKTASVAEPTLTEYVRSVVGHR